ncbi:MAG: hypothetical protein PUE75_02685, partial [Eubacteriales bacterium]|nr:hypothetical protein [Eubacteriales bacterium]
GLFFPNQRFGATVSCALHNSLPEQKTKNAKSGINVEFMPLFKLLSRCNSSGLALQAPTSNFYFSHTLACFRPLYRQSKPFALCCERLKYF